MSILRLNAACRASTESMDEMAESAESLGRKVLSIREKLNAGKAERRGEVLAGLEANFYTEAGIKTYMQLLQADPDDPDLNKIEYEVIERFGGGEALSIVRLLRRAARKARNASRKLGDRSKGLSQESFDDVLREVTGGTFP